MVGWMRSAVGPRHPLIMGVTLGLCSVPASSFVSCPNIVLSSPNPLWALVRRWREYFVSRHFIRTWSQTPCSFHKTWIARRWCFHCWDSSHKNLIQLVQSSSLIQTPDRELRALGSKRKTFTGDRFFGMWREDCWVSRASNNTAGNYCDVERHVFVWQVLNWFRCKVVALPLALGNSWDIFYSVASIQYTAYSIHVITVHILYTRLRPS